ncbi:hypothetical protein [Halomontanus rarus]|nr:hypothetical protein [Halovivax sp. TS33]
MTATRDEFGGFLLEFVYLREPTEHSLRISTAPRTDLPVAE